MPRPISKGNDVDYSSTFGNLSQNREQTWGLNSLQNLEKEKNEQDDFYSIQFSKMDLSNSFKSQLVKKKSFEFFLKFGLVHPF